MLRPLVYFSLTVSVSSHKHFRVQINYADTNFTVWNEREGCGGSCVLRAREKRMKSEKVTKERNAKDEEVMQCQTDMMRQ